MCCYCPLAYTIPSLLSTNETASLLSGNGKKSICSLLWLPNEIKGQFGLKHYFYFVFKQKRVECFLSSELYPETSISGLFASKWAFYIWWYEQKRLVPKNRLQNGGRQWRDKWSFSFILYRNRNMELNFPQELKSGIEWNPSRERLIVVSNRLPFVLKRDDSTGKLIRKSRQVEFVCHLYEHT